MRICRESLIISGLCLADLVSTIVLVQRYGAEEGNWIMRYYLDHGLAAFIGAKLLLFVPALLIAEWYRRRNPRLVLQTLRAVIVLYVGFYSLGIYSLNRQHHFFRDLPGWRSEPVYSPPRARLPEAF